MDTHYLRERLAQLRVVTESSNTTNTLLDEPILSPDEIAKEPLKWLKYLVMDRTGLEPIDKVAHQINRFRLSDIEIAKGWVNDRLEVSDETDQRKMVVAKVVPWDSGAQLMNYRMFSTSDVVNTFDQIANDFKGATHELWCCESPVSNKGLNLGGRINYPQPGRDQLLELVWFASPRFIERVSLPDFEYPYLSAIRACANPAFRIEVLHIPSEYSVRYNHATWEDDLKRVAQELERKRSAMNTLAYTVKSLGAREVCFCFKMMEERLTIIDWDSEIESTDDN